MWTNFADENTSLKHHRIYVHSAFELAAKILGQAQARNTRHGRTGSSCYDYSRWRIGLFCLVQQKRQPLPVECGHFARLTRPDCSLCICRLINPINSTMANLTGVVFLAGIYVSLSAICPPLWQQYGESCYIVVTETMTWFQANRTCHSTGAKLAVPNSQGEQTFIWKMYEQISHGRLLKVKGLWIGCNDLEEHGKWKHCPLSGRNNSYANWRGNQPKNRNAHCVAMTRRGNGRWGDKLCKKEIYAVCELRASSSSAYCTQTGADGRVASRCLSGHVIKELPATGVVSCGKACRSEPRSRFFNLLEQGPRKRVCQLNNVNLRDAADENMHPERQNCVSFDL